MKSLQAMATLEGATGLYKENTFYSTKRTHSTGPQTHEEPAGDGQTSAHPASSCWSFLSLSLSLSLPPCLVLLVPLSLTHSLTLSLSHSLIRSVSLILSLSLSFSLSLSLSLFLCV